MQLVTVNGKVKSEMIDGTHVSASESQDECYSLVVEWASASERVIAGAGGLEE